MSTVSERGHAKNLANFEQAISIAESLGANYQPSNPRIQIQNMKNKLNECKNLAEANRQQVALKDDITNQREIRNKELIPRSIRAVAYLKSTGVAKQTIKDAEAYIRLMRGARAASSKAKAKTVASEQAAEDVPQPMEAETLPKTISVAHTGYHNQVEHFANLLELLKNQPLYVPMEAEIGTPALQVFLDELNSLNSQVTTVSTQTQTSLFARNEEMYHDENGLPNTFTELKAYVLAILGNKAPQLKALRKLGIVNLKR